MNRLGLWGPGTAFRDFSEFLQSVEKRYGIFVMNCESFTSFSFHQLLIIILAKMILTQDNNSP